VSDEEVARMMRRYDGNDDGRISAEEAQRTERLKFVFTTYDKSGDGFIDMAEMKLYSLDRANDRVPPPPSGGGWNGGGGGWNGGGGGWNGNDQGGDRRGSRDNVAPPEEEKPIAVRFGKLPANLPGWFTALDTDKDGQVGMYEWRADKRQMGEFLTMDLNSDGLLTAEEYLRFKKLTTTSETKVETTSSISRESGSRGRESYGKERGDRNNGGKEKSKEEKKESKNGNPFRDR